MRLARLGLLVALTACGGSEARIDEPSPSATARGTAPPSEAPPEASDDGRDVEERGVVDVMLRRVTRARELEVKRPIGRRVLPRGAILERIRAHVDREVPRHVLHDQGESLTLLGLVPPEYDFVQGVFALLEGRIAGFYEPEDGTMYLVDDLDDEEAVETLAHELVHAVQDQNFSLKSLLKFVPGDSDRLAAGHSLAEGDAMSAMFDAMQEGSAANLDPDALRFAFSFSTSLSTSGSKAPHVIQASLTAPYTDGFRLVQQLRRRGGWRAVDDVWRSLPATTEQLLHLDKLDSREPALPVAAPTAGPLGEGWRVTLDEVMGEQGLSLVLAEWTSRDIAARAAAGWGGDRYVILRRGPAPAPPPAGAPAGSGTRPDGAFALAWRVDMDTEADARELAQVLDAQLGKTRCRERADVGPVAYKRDGAALAIVAGPYERTGDRGKAISTCAAATAWAASAVARPAAPARR